MIVEQLCKSTGLTISIIYPNPKKSITNSLGMKKSLGLLKKANPLEDFDDWQQESIQEAAQVLSSDDYLELPSKFDIHEYSIMEDVCHYKEDEGLRNRSSNAIRG